MTINEYIPGYLQGVTRVLISHPFDYVRTFIQSNKSINVFELCKINTFTKLYKGVSLPLLTVPIDRAIQFKIYEKLIKHNDSPFVNGFICGLISTSYMLPFNTIINTYIIKNVENDSLLKHIGKYIKTPKLLYNGLKPEIMRSLMGTSLYLGTYGKLRQLVGNENIIHYSINGILAGWAVWTFTYPFDTIKLEQQINNDKIINILNNRIKQFGIFNLWKGIGLVYIRTIPSSLCGTIVYEYSRKILQKK